MPSISADLLEKRLVILTRTQEQLARERDAAMRKLRQIMTRTAQIEGQIIETQFWMTVLETDVADEAKQEQERAQ